MFCLALLNQDVWDCWIGLADLDVKYSARVNAIMHRTFTGPPRVPFHCIITSIHALRVNDFPLLISLHNVIMHVARFRATSVKYPTVILLSLVLPLLILSSFADSSVEIPQAVSTSATFTKAFRCENSTSSNIGLRWKEVLLNSMSNLFSAYTLVKLRAMELYWKTPSSVS